MNFLNFTIIKLSVVLIAGILTGFYLDISREILLIALLLTFVTFLISFLRTRQQLFQDNLFGISIFLLMFVLGISLVYLHQPENKPGHFIHAIPAEESSSSLKIKITEKLKPGLYADKFIVEAKSFLPKIPDEETPIGKNTLGKLLMNVSRDSLDHDLRIGDELLVPFRPSDINTPLNPYQFNYSAYMEQLGVLKQLNLAPAEIFFLEASKNEIRPLASNFRNKIITKLKANNFSAEEMSIIQALLLGQRQDISADIYSNYAAAGAIHILAVSGLHVGIILLLLNWLLKPLNHLKGGRFIKTILLLILMWGFAVVAGLSPSVVRAVSMFSFVAIGMQINRKTSVMNSLFISLFLLLLINPYFIFQVGFQLSYLAVFAIVSLQPFLYQLYSPRIKIIRYFWGILTVSVAAQIGVLPLSLYYFHQFPGLFFLSNLIILPFLGVILGMGILIILLAWVEILPAILAGFYGKIISSLNAFIAWIAKQEDFVFTEIHLPISQTLTLYLALFVLVLLIHQRNFRNLVFLLTAIISFQLISIYEKNAKFNSESIIFHKSRYTLLGFKTPDKLKIFDNLKTTPVAETSIINYKMANGIKTLERDTLQNIFDFSGETLLLIDSTGVYNARGLRPDLVLLTHSPKINLERMLERTKAKMIIADGSNYTTYVNRWEATCEKQKIPFHHTGEKGFFYINNEISNSGLFSNLRKNLQSFLHIRSRPPEK